MARTSSVQIPADDQFVMIRESFVGICEGNQCAAAMLNFYIFRHDSKLSEVEEKEANSRNYNPTQSDFLVKCSNSYMAKHLKGLFGRNSIIEANALMVHLGFIEITENSSVKEAGKPTNHILVFPKKINERLKTNVRNIEGERPFLNVQTFKKGRSERLKTNVQTFKNKRNIEKEKEKEIEESIEGANAQKKLPLSSEKTETTQAAITAIVEANRRAEAPPVAPPPPQYGKFADEKEAVAFLLVELSDESNLQSVVNYCNTQSTVFSQTDTSAYVSRFVKHYFSELTKQGATTLFKKRSLWAIQKVNAEKLEREVQERKKNLFAAPSKINQVHVEAFSTSSNTLPKRNYTLDAAIKSFIVKTNGNWDLISLELKNRYVRIITANYNSVATDEQLGVKANSWRKEIENEIQNALKIETEYV
jgi:hypothetical protein